MADEPILNDAWEVLKGNVACTFCDGTGLGESLEKQGDVYEVTEGACAACDGAGWTTLDQFRSRYWGEYMLLVASWSGDKGPNDEAIDRQLGRWQNAMRRLRERD